jgi:hypothetical protein
MNHSYANGVAPGNITEQKVKVEWSLRVSKEHDIKTYGISETCE